MNSSTVIFCLLLCTVIVNCRTFGERTGDETDDNVRRTREHGSSQMRHRRRSYQMNYGYEYPQPPNPYYNDNRREYDQSQDLMPQILRLLDEIAAYVRRPAPLPPPPPPQPIYVPYPMPYPLPQYCNCPTRRVNISDPAIRSRFPEMDDANQNWGFADTNEEVEDESDGSRPISFVPIIPKRPRNRIQPKVEHGSQQAGANGAQVPIPIDASASNELPAKCDVASLVCCNGTPNQQRQCFNNMGCGFAYNNGNACSREKIANVINAYSKAYSPVN